MPSKKELQEQIDELKERFDRLNELLVIAKDNMNTYYPINTNLLKESERIEKYFSSLSEIHYVLDTKELRKQFLALLDYLKLEYKVEDKHLEGFKKK